jgi:hypothetical protein
LGNPVTLPVTGLLKTMAAFWMWDIPKGPCAKGLVPWVALLGGDGAFKRWGVVGGLQVVGGVLEGTVKPQLLLP